VKKQLAEPFPGLEYYFSSDSFQRGTPVSRVGAASPLQPSAPQSTPETGRVTPLTPAGGLPSLRGSVSSLSTPVPGRCTEFPPLTSGPQPGGGSGTRAPQGVQVQVAGGRAYSTPSSFSDRRKTSPQHNKPNSTRL